MASLKLKSGDKGKQVKELQEKLNQAAKPKPKLKTDGKFGPMTEEALKGYQKKNKLKQDGIASDKTLFRLMEGLGGAAMGVGIFGALQAAGGKGKGNR